MKTIVISDLHLGLDDSLSETVKNRPKLAAFIEMIGREHLADELVINGDFLDHWFYPATANAPRSSHEFYKACATNNAEVIEAIKDLVRSGTPVVYVPGNHDMTLTSEALKEIIPGIIQARDMPGLGRYRTGVRGEVVIEHGHRYEILCAPNTIANASIMEYGHPLLPPGYFFIRLKEHSIAEGRYANPARNAACRKIPPTLPEPNPNDKQACAEYAYWKLWADIVSNWFPVEEELDDKFIEVAVDGLVGTFSLRDLLPVTLPGEDSASQLFQELIPTWEEMQRRNLVPTRISAQHSIEHPTSDEEDIEVLPALEFFDVDPSADVVVLGHTHVAGYKEFPGYDRPKIFANCGTWVDTNGNDPENTATFVLVESTDEGDTVSVLKCEGDTTVERIVPVQNDHIRPGK